MDKLKRFIDTNREAFEDEELPEGHFERFEHKLTKPQRGRTLAYSLSALAVAASIALLFVFLPWEKTPRQVNIQVCEAKEEIEELRLYYNMQMHDVLSEMEAIYTQNRTPGRAELLRETKQVLTDNFLFEETILPTLPCSNDGLFAMTQHYSNSLESLSFMLKQMERVNSEKQNYNN